MLEGMGRGEPGSPGVPRGPSLPELICRVSFRTDSPLIRNLNLGHIDLGLRPKPRLPAGKPQHTDGPVFFLLAPSRDVRQKGFFARSGCQSPVVCSPDDQREAGLKGKGWMEGERGDCVVMVCVEITARRRERPWPLNASRC